MNLTKGRRKPILRRTGVEPGSLAAWDGENTSMAADLH
jgi:hypothetical protein